MDEHSKERVPATGRNFPQYRQNILPIVELERFFVIAICGMESLNCLLSSDVNFLSQNLLWWALPLISWLWDEFKITLFIGHLYGCYAIDVPS